MGYRRNADGSMEDLKVAEQRVIARFTKKIVGSLVGIAATVGFGYASSAYSPEAPKKAVNDQIYQYTPSNTGSNEALALIFKLAAIGSAISVAVVLRSASKDSLKVEAIRQDINDQMFWNEKGELTSPGHYDPKKHGPDVAAVPTAAPQSAAPQ